MGERIARLGKALDGGVRAYNELVGTIEARVLPQARRFRDVEAHDPDRAIPGQLALQIPRRKHLADADEEAPVRRAPRDGGELALPASGDQGVEATSDPDRVTVSDPLPSTVVARQVTEEPRMSTKDDIELLVARKPGLTEIEIATELFGGDAYQQKVNSQCRLLINEGRVERRGRGGNGDPFTYYPTRAGRTSSKW